MMALGIKIVVMPRLTAVRTAAVSYIAAVYPSVSNEATEGGKPPTKKDGGYMNLLDIKFYTVLRCNGTLRRVATSLMMGLPAKYSATWSSSHSSGDLAPCWPRPRCLSSSCTHNNVLGKGCTQF